LSHSDVTDTGTSSDPTTIRTHDANQRPRWRGPATAPAEPVASSSCWSRSFSARRRASSLSGASPVAGCSDVGVSSWAMGATLAVRPTGTPPPAGVRWRSVGVVSAFTGSDPDAPTATPDRGRVSPSSCDRWSGSDGADVLGFVALAAGTDLELDLLS